MTVWELSLLCLQLFCKSKLITKYNVIFLKRKRSEKGIVPVTAGEWGHPPYEAAALGSGSADFLHWIDFILFATTDIIRLKFKWTRLKEEGE